LLHSNALHVLLEKQLVRREKGAEVENQGEELRRHAAGATDPAEARPTRRVG
jgi:hypothetical protein